MAVDISNLDAKSLATLEAKIEERKKSLEAEHAQKAVTEARAIADKYGIPAAVLGRMLGGRLKKAAAPKIVKFRNPKKPEETWAGRGRKPDWLVKALKGGKKLQDFAV